jgi:hypothetical protein
LREFAGRQAGLARLFPTVGWTVREAGQPLPPAARVMISVKPCLNFSQPFRAKDSGPVEKRQPPIFVRVEGVLE